MTGFKIPSYVDAEGAVVNWVNSRTDDLVGPGNPIPLGLRFNEPRKAGPAHRGAFGLVTAIGGDNTFRPEGGVMRANLSVSFFADKRESAARAAYAYANVIEQLSVLRPLVLQGTAQLLFTDAVSGPTFISYDDQEQYLISADFYLQVVTPQVA